MDGITHDTHPTEVETVTVPIPAGRRILFACTRDALRQLAPEEVRVMVDLYIAAVNSDDEDWIIEADQVITRLEMMGTKVFALSDARRHLERARQAVLA